MSERLEDLTEKLTIVRWLEELEEDCR